MKNEARNLSELLPDLRLHEHDPVWLDENADRIHYIIRRGMHESNIDDWVNTLKLVTPHFLRRPGYRQWEALITYGLPHAMNTRWNNMLHDLWQMLGQFSLIGDKPFSAVSSFKHALGYAANSKEKIDSNIGLVMSEIFTGGNYNSVHYNNLLTYPIKSNSYRQAKIYRTLAQYQLYQGNATEALRYAQTAHSIYQGKYRGKGNVTPDMEKHMGTSLLIKAIAYRLAGNFKLMGENLDLSRKRLERFPYEEDLMINSFEHGVLAYHEQRYEDAVQWFEEVLAYFKVIDYPRYSALASYSLALAVTPLGRYEEALNLLYQALDQWDKLKDPIEMANTQLALGYVFLVQHNEKDAYQWFGKAIATAKGIPVEGIRKQVTARIDADLRIVQRKYASNGVVRSSQLQPFMHHSIMYLR